ncbi:HNH endonuclease [Nakamurella endophytica]|uniref:HNH endonuclease n=1 Tax=Nakamurella endophytica TaxID=1748367 RepID=A0A917WJ13_9ACTN|nr:DUF222 domain-containing protein [Nakamurella endophytica]GGM07621.1 HNH endonuclease [Nakamurella endophytica]
MFETGGVVRGATTADVVRWTSAVAELRPVADDAERIDRIAALERLKAACAAAQAEVTAELVRSQRTAAASAGQDRTRTDRSIAAQVAFARRESPHAGRRHVGLAMALIDEMPGTLTALRDGSIPEWRAVLVARQLGCLTAEARRKAETELAPRLPALGDQAAVAAATTVAYRLDPEAVLDRMRNTVSDRRVSLRPAPDTMVRLSALLPVAGGVAAYAPLLRAADSSHASDGTRTRGQVMADELVARLTGRSNSGCDELGVPDAGAPDVHIGLLMTDRTLLDADAEPAVLNGCGPIPAPLARRLVDAGAGTASPASVWVRRCWTDPSTGSVAVSDRRPRLFPASIRRLVVWRDQRCRTPWCGAPVRDIDHVHPFRAGGSTVQTNAKGLCRSRNLAKDQLGWHAPGRPDGAVVTETPTGHRYVSHPPPPSSEPWRDDLVST